MHGRPSLKHNTQNKNGAEIQYFTKIGQIFYEIKKEASTYYKAIKNTPLLFRRLWAKVNSKSIMPKSLLCLIPISLSKYS